MPDLITLDNVRQSMRLEANQTGDDSFITDLITRVEDIAEEYCNRIFLAATYTDDYYDGDGSPYLFLDQFPVNSSASQIELWDDVDRNFTDVSYKMGADDIIVYSKEGIIALYGNAEFPHNRLVDSVAVFNNGRQNIKITYNAGYSQANLPGGLKDSLISMVIRRYRQYTKNELGLISKSNPDGSVSYVGDIFLTKWEERALDKYKKPGFRAV